MTLQSTRLHKSLFQNNVSFFILVNALLICLPLSSRSQVDLSTGCAATECRFTQNIGTTNSVSVGITSSLGASSTAQGSLHHQVDSSSSVSLDNPRTDSSTAFGKNVTYQALGGNFVDVIGTDGNLYKDPDGKRVQTWQSSPVNISINTNSDTQISTLGSITEDNGSGNQSFRQASDSGDSGFVDNEKSTIEASLSAAGLSAYQDLRLTGESDTSSGTYAKSSVKQLVRKEPSKPVYKKVPLTDENGEIVTESVPRLDSNGSPLTTTQPLIQEGVILRDGNNNPIMVDVPVFEQKIVYVDTLEVVDQNPILEDDYGTGSASANVNTSTRFNADVTNSTFVNAFFSSF